MKKNFLLITALAGISTIILSSYGSGPANGGLGNISAAGCSGGTCHGNANNNTGINITVRDGSTEVTSYVPGKQYTVYIGSENSANLARFGFQASCVKASAPSVQAGTLAVGSTANTAVRTGTTPNVVEHTSPIAASPTAGFYAADFKWTAPAAGTGIVQIQVALNAVNFNGTSTGDQWNVATKTLSEGASSVGGYARNISLTSFPNPAVNQVLLDIKGASSQVFDATIMDMTGRIVGQQRINTQAPSVDVSRLSGGHYVIRLTGKDEQGSVRFVK